MFPKAGGAHASKDMCRVDNRRERPIPEMAEPHRFRNRQDAGRRLAALLARYGEQHPVVVGIPRGGVPVAAEVARALGAPLDVVVARKLGAPMNPEYGIGAIAEGGARVVSEQALARLRIGPHELAALLARTEGELAILVGHLRDGRPPLSVQGRTVILVDDGLATGRTARAAAVSLRRRGAARVVLAVPVAAASSAAELRSSVDEVMCEQMPEDLWAIGFWYEDFSPTSEAEVSALLSQAAAARSGDCSPPDPRP
jgi:putative phosphoribosyl transferase